MKGSAHLYDAFQQKFTAKPTQLFFAPGRINLIGDHTDYSGGFVFPAALDVGTWVAVRPRSDGKFRLASTQFPETWEGMGADVGDATVGGWTRYPRGVIRVMKEEGAALSGADLLFAGDMPVSAGLSSSASIQMATATALAALEPEKRWEKPALAHLVQKAENEFIGVQCGILDPFTSVMGREGHGILLRCDHMQFEWIPLELGDYQLIIIHSGKERGLDGSRYNERRAELEQGWRQLSALLPPDCRLADVTAEQWERLVPHLTSDESIKRLQHVITENDRVQQSAEALKRGDVAAFGKWMAASHRSLRDQYEVTGYELDALFEAAMADSACVGSRMTGAGFGGCTVHLVKATEAEGFVERVTTHYGKKTGLTPRVIPCRIGAGARERTQEVFSWRSS
ncbi:galactokinase [Desmospora activa]|uniref:Galactokinase n=1 Tax=Desmospora activa DSM 45169 TaxID=1121389 RepID=A0A2T4ZB77_9BACL|nr:galactokinase [Desmospora activa]PTM59154.1 galactokinase [Desmospora activa DSM 45169]